MMGDFNMDKDLIQLLKLNETEVLTNYGDIDSDKVVSDDYKVLKVKVFSAGLLTNETINKLNIQSTEYKEFININDIELEALKNNDELLCETDLVLLVGEYEDTEGMTKLNYIIQNAGSRVCSECI
jgi:hypothetical protein